jgi:hypothetical protein
MTHRFNMCFTFLRGLHQDKLCEVGAETGGIFYTLELATLAVNCMSDGAVEVLADRGQEVAKETARVAAK